MKRGILSVIVAGCVILSASAVVNITTATKQGRTTDAQSACVESGIGLNPSNRLNTSPEQAKAHAMKLKPQPKAAAKQAPMHGAPLETYADLPVLYGYNYDTHAWNTLSPLPAGIYSFHPSEVISYTAEAVPGPPEPMAAFYAKGKYYTLTCDNNEPIHAWITVHDATTWQLIDGPVQVGDGSWDYYWRQVAVYDPETNLAYTATWGNGKPLVSINLDTYETKVLGPTDTFVQTLFLDKDNRLYGIDFWEKGLYTYDKATGAATLVGTLDVPFSLSGDAMSAVTDPSTGITYWVAVDADLLLSYLYTIDLATAKCTLIAKMPTDEHMLGLYIPYTDPAAPGATTGNVYADGVLSFIVPITTYTTGASLSSALTAVATIDGVEHTLSATPGQKVTIEKALGDGPHTFSIYVRNEVGNGPERRFNTFVGNDAPACVEDLALKIIDERASLSWTAPTTSLYGGPFQPADVRYRVVRYPDETVIATDLAECECQDLIPEARAHYSYGVTPYIGNSVGMETVSDEVPAGTVYHVPFTETFATQEDYDFGLVDDFNDDGASWIYMPSYQAAYFNGPGIDYDGDQQNNDYYISGAIALQAGIDYRFTTKFSNGYYPETLRLLLGTQQEATGHETVLKDEFVVPFGTEVTEEAIFNVPADGIYYLMVHDVTRGNSVMLLFDEFSVTIEGVFDAPNAVTGLTATAGAQGAISNSLSFTTPTTTYTDAALDEITKIEIYRNGGSKPYATIAAPAMGALITWDDPKPVEGVCRYDVVAFNSKGQGRTASVTNWVGIDIPSIPVATSYMTNDIKPGFKWTDATAEGMHGGYVDTDAVKYRLYRYNPMIWDFPWEIVADEIDVLDIIDNSYNSISSPAKPYQEYLDYAVTAYNSKGESEKCLVGVTVGDPYARPYTESFAQGLTTTSPWTLITDSYYYAWNCVNGDGLAVKPYDNDGGMLEFFSYETTSDQQVIQSPRISLAGAQKPQLSFYMYHGSDIDEGVAAVKLYANVDDKGFDLMDEYDCNIGIEGWVRHSLLFPADANNVILAFGAVAPSTGISMCIDHIVIEEALDYDIALAAIDVQKRVENGQEGRVSVLVNNIGLETAEEYSVVLYRDNEVYNSEHCNELEANQLQTVVFYVPTTIKDATCDYRFHAEIVYDKDQNADNNACEAKTMHVIGVPYPTVAITGAIQGDDVVISWAAPESNKFPAEECDGFDDYEPFIIDGIGDWTTYDGDERYPVYFGGPAIPYMFELQAWQIWNPELAGFSLAKFPMLTPHSGEQYLANWSASDGDTSILANDDWLISSDVVGGTDVSFWACNPNDGAAAQKYEILYSTTDDNPASFSVLDEGSIEGTTDWVYVIATLPKDAQYFAIRSCGDAYVNRTVLFIDDITFTPRYGGMRVLDMDGYNVYRDGELLAHTEDTSYVDAGTAYNVYTYNVTINWAEGESVFSNSYVTGQSSIVDAPQGLAVVVAYYDMQGRRLERPAKGSICVARYSDGSSRLIIK